MAIYREVSTEVYCDICGEKVIGWNSVRNGVSKIWAAYFARQEGCTTGKKIVCKQCRIKQRMEKCSLQKKYGTAGKDGSGACLGFGSEWDDEPIEQCKRCIACASFDWDEEKKRLSIGERKRGRAESVIVDCYNEGDVSTGMRVRFVALGTVKNPILLNVDTGEFIKINVTMQTGDTIEVSTKYGSKGAKLIRDGVETDYFRYVDVDSTYMQLAIGDNNFRYDAESGVNSMEVSIFYNKEYLGV